MPLGDGGMVVSKHKKVIDFVKKFSNYSKWDYAPRGLNCRMSEINAAFGIVQLQRLPKILNWKKRLAKKYDKIFENRVMLPKDMISGYYKYIVFDYKLKEETGKVFGDPIHYYKKTKYKLPNSDWIAKHHSCLPMWYGWDKANLTIKQLKEELTH